MIGPTVVGVYITDRCNQKCYYCPYLKTRHRRPDKKDVTPELLNRILDEFPTLQTVRFGGAGEPLVAFHIAESIKIAIDRGKRVALPTNGTKIRAHGEDVPWKDIAEINVSVSAVGADAYKSVTGTNLFDEMVAGMEYLRNKEANLTTSLAVDVDGLSRVEEFLLFSAEHGSKVAVIQALLPQLDTHTFTEEGIEEFWRVAITQQNAEAMERLKEQQELAKSISGKLKGMRIRWPAIIDRTKKPPGCKMARIYVSVDGHGHLAMCCRGDGPRPEMGNISHGLESWTSGPIAELRKRVYGDNQPIKCSRCFANYSGKG